MASSAIFPTTSIAVTAATMFNPNLRAFFITLSQAIGTIEVSVQEALLSALGDSGLATRPFQQAPAQPPTNSIAAKAAAAVGAPTKGRSKKGAVAGVVKAVKSGYTWARTVLMKIYPGDINAIVRHYEKQWKELDAVTKKMWLEHALTKTVPPELLSLYNAAVVAADSKKAAAKAAKTAPASVPVGVPVIVPAAPAAPAAPKKKSTKKKAPAIAPPQVPTAAQ